MLTIIHNNIDACLPNVIVVSHYPTEGEIVNWGYLETPPITPADFGAWRIKYKAKRL